MNQSEILATIKTTLKDLMENSKSYYPSIYLFENKYNTLKKNLALYIENEENQGLKKCYLIEYMNIVAFETKSKGLNLVRSNYEESIKPKASDKSKGVFESSLKLAAEHIANDFDTFFNLIPKDDNE